MTTRQEKLGDNAYQPSINQPRIDLELPHHPHPQQLMLYTRTSQHLGLRWCDYIFSFFARIPSNALTPYDSIFLLLELLYVLALYILRSTERWVIITPDKLANQPDGVKGWCEPRRGRHT